MSSVIKVDQIQTAAGGTPTAGDLGINTTGTVLQVKNNAVNVSVRLGQTTSTSYVATGYYLDFTPKSVSSTLYISLSIGMQYTSATTSSINTSIARDGSLIGTGNYNTFIRDLGSPMYGPLAITMVDTPNTTSTTRYEVYVKSQSGDNVIGIHEGCYTNIVITEIAG